MIIHLVSRVEWETDPTSSFEPASLAEEGFIHCARDEAVALAVANAFYREAPRPFLALDIDEDRLTADVVWESADPAPPPGVEDGVAFPHLYGPLDRAAVVRTRTVVWSDAGHAVGFSE